MFTLFIGSSYRHMSTLDLKPRLHEHQVPNPDSNLDHNLHGRGGLSPDLNPLCLRVNATSLDQDLDQNARVNGAIDACTLHYV